MELIKIVQFPELEEKFKEIDTEVAAKVERCKSLVVTDDNYKEIKKTRAELNKEAKAYADDFKAIKGKALEPWNAIEEKYNAVIRDGYKLADGVLKEKINEVEDEMKRTKAEEVERFYDEYAASLGIDFVPFGRSEIKVTMSASMKSLKEQAKEFLNKIATDIESINSQGERAVEIMAEYKLRLDFAKSIMAVSERHAREKVAAEEAEKRKEAERAEMEAAAKVKQYVEPPKEKEPEVHAAFRVYGTKAQLKGLADYMRANGIRFENIKEEENERITEKRQ